MTPELKYLSNLDNLAQALLKCGYFVSYTDSIEQVFTVRTIRVYTDRF